MIAHLVEGAPADHEHVWSQPDWSTQWLSRGKPMVHCMRAGCTEVGYVI